MPAPLSSLQQTFQSFDGISRLLREGVADEDSRQLRDSLGALSMQIDEVTRLRRTGIDAHAITRRVVDLARCARQHQLFLTELGSAWHALYEFDAYQRAFGALRDAIAAWQRALEQHSPREQACFRQFELLAWRTLGEALLLIDIYEQPGDAQSDLSYALPQRLSGWQRVRAWFQRQWR